MGIYDEKLFGNRNNLLALAGLAGASGLAAGTLLGNALIKRKAYFAFHYDDIMRVNNVRNAWLIDHPDSDSSRSFYDSSLWESKKLNDPDAIKKLIREGVEYTSAVCVLIGSDTWSRRWVKYEIARSVIDKKGLLAVHLNGINHHQRKSADELGYNPLHLMGLWRSPQDKYYLYEKRHVVTNALTGQGEWQWLQYQDYTSEVSLPQYLTAPTINYIQPLSSAAKEYNFSASDGHKNIGRWIDEAAKAAGR